MLRVKNEKKGKDRQFCELPSNLLKCLVVEMVEVMNTPCNQQLTPFGQRSGNDHLLINIKTALARFKFSLRKALPEPLICRLWGLCKPLRPLSGTIQPTDWGHPYSLTTANKLSSVMPVVLFPF